MTQGMKLVVLTCVLASMVGCSQNNNKKSDKTMTASKWKSKSGSAATTRPSWNDSGWAADPTTRPSMFGIAANPLQGEWQLAIPRRPVGAATIVATDPTHVTITAGRTLSGDYIVQGSYLLMLSQDPRLQPLAWRINSDDSITIVRPPDLGPGSAAFTGITMLRAADSSMTEADMGELTAP